MREHTDKIGSRRDGNNTPVQDKAVQITALGLLEIKHCADHMALFVGLVKICTQRGFDGKTNYEGQHRLDAVSSIEWLHRINVKSGEAYAGAAQRLHQEEYIYISTALVHW